MPPSSPRAAAVPPASPRPATPPAPPRRSFSRSFSGAAAFFSLFDSEPAAPAAGAGAAAGAATTPSPSPPRADTPPAPSRRSFSRSFSGSGLFGLFDGDGAGEDEDGGGDNGGGDDLDSAGQSVLAAVSLPSLPGRCLASATLDGNVRVFDMTQGGHCLFALCGGHFGAVTSLAALADARLVSSGQDGRICVWALSPRTLEFTLRGHVVAVTCVCLMLAPDRRLCSAGEDGSLAVWNVDPLPPSAPATTVAEGPGASAGTGAGAGEGARDAEAGAGASADAGADAGDAGSSSSESSGSGAAASAAAGAGAGALDASSGDSGASERCLMRFAAGETVRCMCAIGPGLIAFGGDSTSINVFDLSAGTVVRRLHGHWREVRSLTLMSQGGPAGARLASGSRDHSAKIWDLDTGKCLFTLRGHAKSVLSVCAIPDAPGCANKLATGSRDGHVRVWDVGLPRRGYMPYVSPLFSMSSRARAKLLGTEGSVWAIVSLGEFGETSLVVAHDSGEMVEWR